MLGDPLVPKAGSCRWYGRMSHVIEIGEGGHALTERQYISNAGSNSKVQL